MKPDVKSKKTMREANFIDVAKALAICMVVVTHVAWSDGDRLNPVFPFLVNAAVPVFMMVTGVNYARSFERRGLHDLRSMYAPSLLARRVKGLVLPFLLFFAAEVLVALLTNGARSEPVSLTLLGLVKGLVSGGWGPGGYYLAVMLQVIVAYPLLHLLVRRYGGRAVAVACVLCLALDAACTLLGLDGGAWRLLAIRYVPYVMLGCLLSSSARLDVRHDAMLMAGGAIYLSAMTYSSAFPFLSSLSFGWLGTSVPSALYFMGAFALAYGKWSEMRVGGGLGSALRRISSDTWFVFLVQSVWFFAGANALLGFLPAPLQACASLAVCVPAGCLAAALYRRVLA